MWPQTVRPDSPLIVAFDQKIDPAKVLPFLRVKTARGRVLPSRPISLAEARPLWARNPSLALTDKLLAELGPNTMILAPATAWPAGTEARVVLAPAAPSAEGPRVSKQESDRPFDIVPAFSVRGIACDDKPPRMTTAICSAWGYLQVETTTPIAIPSYRAQMIQIAGEPFEDNVPRDAAVGLSTPRPPGRAYTIDVAAGITDVYGQPMVGSRKLAFTTTLQRFEPYVDVHTGLFILDPRFETPQWVMSMQAVARVHVQLYKVEPADYFAYEELESGNRKTPPGKRVFDKTYPVGARIGADLRVDSASRAVRGRDRPHPRDRHRRSGRARPRVVQPQEHRVDPGHPARDVRAGRRRQAQRVGDRHLAHHLAEGHQVRDPALDRAVEPPLALPRRPGSRSSPRR